MNDNDEIMFVADENLTTVLSMFFKEFKGNPLAFVPMDEAIEMFKQDFEATDGGFLICEATINPFMHKINALACDRMMADMVKKGLVDYMHDGTDWVWTAKK